MNLSHRAAQSRRLVANALRGFAMGTADLVPGVSGGTMAYLLGIYTQLIEAISHLVAGLAQLLRRQLSMAKRRLSQVGWSLLLPVLAGLVTAVFSLAPAMRWLLDNYPEDMAGAFCGIVLASVAVGRLDLSQSAPVSQPESMRRPANIWAQSLLVAAVTVSVFVLLGLSADPRASAPLLIFFGSGALAACAMVLPGISGSFMLLMVGMYGPALDALADRDFPILLVLLAGAVVGLALATPVLRHWLRRAPRIANAVLLGLLLGSLRVLWPWPDGVGIISRDSQKVIDGTQLGWPDWGQVWSPTLLAAVFFVLGWGGTKLGGVKPSGTKLDGTKLGGTKLIQPSGDDLR